MSPLPWNGADTNSAHINPKAPVIALYRERATLRTSIENASYSMSSRSGILNCCGAFKLQGISDASVTGVSKESQVSVEEGFCSTT